MIKIKKSQMEILGLAIVIVLILVATIFIVNFLVLRPATEYRKGFVSSELASNTLNAFLKTAAQGCSQLTMTELLQDCAQGDDICCQNCNNNNPADTIDDVNSCEFVEITANSILTKTLTQWNMKYEFLAYTDINSPLIKLGQQCRGEKNSKIFPIPTSVNTMYTKLDICG